MELPSLYLTLKEKVVTSFTPVARECNGRPAVQGEAWSLKTLPSAGRDHTAPGFWVLGILCVSVAGSPVMRF